LKSYAARITLCLSLLTPVFAVAATKAAPPAKEGSPELLNAPASPSTPAPTATPADPKKEDAAKAVPTPEPAAVPPTTPSPPVTAPKAAPATSTAQALPPPSEPAADHTLDRLFTLTITDILIALFTLVVALFAWRLSGAVARLASTSQSHADITRRSVEASERAAEAARRSADAAEKSSTVMQDQSARQLRPYVTVKEFLQGPVKDDKQFLHGWVFQVVWQNTGATPTRGFRYWAALRQFDHEIPADFDFAAPMLADFAGGELGSHSTVTSGTLFVSQQDVLQIQSGTRKAVLYGKAEYHDVAGQDVKRETRFCVEVVLVSDPGGAQATPFSFSYFQRHNAIS
jgi:outer membrane biosynthesis protein TonB